MVLSKDAMLTSLTPWIVIVASLENSTTVIRNEIDRFVYGTVLIGEVSIHEDVPVILMQVPPLEQYGLASKVTDPCSVIQLSGELSNKMVCIVVGDLVSPTTVGLQVGG